MNSLITNKNFFSAIQSSNICAINIFLQEKFDIRVKALFGESLLHFAIEKSCIAGIEALLEAGADVNAKRNDGWTPLHLAVEKGCVTVVAMLLEAGADPEAKNQYKETPLHLAAYQRNSKITKILLSGGADTRSKNEFEETPLHLAVEKGYIAVIHALLSAGADIHAKRNGGWTPLHLSAAKGYRAVTKVLLAAGADIDAKNQFEETPLHLAVTKGHIAMVCALLRAGADIHAKNPRGETPLHLAAQRDRVEVAKLLLEAGADVGPALQQSPFIDFCIRANSLPLWHYMLVVGLNTQLNSPKDCTLQISDPLLKKEVQAIRESLVDDTKGADSQIETSQITHQLRVWFCGLRTLQATQYKRDSYRHSLEGILPKLAVDIILYFLDIERESIERFAKQCGIEYAEAEQAYHIWEGHNPGLFQFYQRHPDVLQVKERPTSIASLTFNP